MFQQNRLEMRAQVVRQIKGDGKGFYMEKRLHAYRSHGQELGKKLPTELNTGGRGKGSEPSTEKLLGVMAS